MAKELSEDFVTGGGIAAYALAISTLKYLENIGVPPAGIAKIIEMAQFQVRLLEQDYRHPAVAKASRLLRQADRQLRSTPTSSH